MAKTKPDKKSSKKRDKSILSGISPSKYTPTSSKSEKATPPPPSPETLLAQATALVHISQPDEALPLAQRALVQLEKNSPAEATLPAMTLIGEIYVELGEIDAARTQFLHAVALDPDGSLSPGSGAEKFLWLAQLSEKGGAESVSWFEHGASSLRREISQLEAQVEAQPPRKGDADGYDADDTEEALAERRRKLAAALCGAAEVYMTDLSWEADAEGRCEALVTEALLVATPARAEVLQTLASVRISQLRPDEARAALARSMALWAGLAPADPDVPDFATRVSLARLLLETEMREEALAVAERLIGEDDQSVEVWYLGGWALYLMGEDKRAAGAAPEGWAPLWRSSREWLRNSLRLFDVLDYEDDRLREHAVELMDGLDKELGPDEGDEDEKEDAAPGDGEVEWEDLDEEDGEDEEEDDEEEEEDDDDDGDGDGDHDDEKIEEKGADDENDADEDMAGS